MIIKYIGNEMGKIKGLALLFKEQRVENIASLEKISGQMYLIVNEGYERFI